MEASAQYPPDLVQAAANLGVPVETLVSQAAEAAAQYPAEHSVNPAPVVQPVLTETREQQLERMLAESQQETQQVRRMAQLATEGRVVGSGGQGLPGGPVQEIPTLAEVEPGIRYSYLNGLITDEQLENQVGPLLAGLLKKHEGGVI